MENKNKLRWVEHVNIGRMWKVRIYHRGGTPKAVEIIDVDSEKVIPVEWESFGVCLNELKRIKNGHKERKTRKAERRNNHGSEGGQEVR